MFIEQGLLQRTGSINGGSEWPGGVQRTGSITPGGDLTGIHKNVNIIEVMFSV